MEFSVGPANTNSEKTQAPHYQTCLIDVTLVVTHGWSLSDFVLMYKLWSGTASHKSTATIDRQ